MKILVTALNDDINAKVDHRFGRARYWYIYDSEKDEGYFIDNSKNMSVEHGAGIQAAASIVDKGVDVVITGNVGPKAFEVLSANNVKIYKCFADLSIKENINYFFSNELEEIQNAGKPHIGG